MYFLVGAVGLDLEVGVAQWAAQGDADANAKKNPFQACVGVFCLELLSSMGFAHFYGVWAWQKGEPQCPMVGFPLSLVRSESVMTSRIEFATCDLCDAHKNDTSDFFRVLPPIFQHFGGLQKFAGPVSTVQCFEDNTLVKQAVDQLGHCRVLVVDGGGSLRKALVGGNLAAAAARNGWAGLVVWGCVRDVAELNAESIGIRALALMPLPTEKRGQGLSDVPVSIAGVRVRPGDWLYADGDGMVIGAQPIHI